MTIIHLVPTNPQPERLIPFAASEGLYATWVYLIAVLGGLATLLFLSDSRWPYGILAITLYFAMILSFLRFARAKRRSGDGFVISFSRTNLTVTCDIFVQTLRLTLLSILLDLFTTKDRFAQLFDSTIITGYQIRLFIMLGILAVLVGIPISFGYSSQVDEEISHYKNKSK